ncbi:hypothetical protein [Streptomyces albireticuli]|uniref:Uncharacterized protein n=1 Tax=Streptomyces albireticuli TaxID=1940 RepID=A0A2A2DHV3_9ACTN|nr:hypothetical protein [Streptomyces albireticuli]MCD9146106.1 hypothetical protein [Streptomyces albireticuli]MCD9166197.1 hypothetical protein [Streptomyces albireticuli]MCD9196510.1 hypothetical protein [Streptomyces albireticuli]PAU50900.1 hypothetical protein CK936_00115 [Streptomyces albireticuli]
MTVNDALDALVVATALRVFAPDGRALVRRVLSAGVRVGTAGLLEDASRTTRTSPQPLISPDEEV